MLDEFGDDAPDKIAYKITTEDGKVPGYASLFIRDESGGLVGCLAINFNIFNISDLMFFSKVFSDFTFISTNTGSRTNNGSLVHFIMISMKFVKRKNLSRD